MTQAKERPILFSGPMIRAILDGRKTVTRRVVKASQFPSPFHERCLSVGVDVALREMYEAGRFEQRPFPYGRPGDRLIVRETFRLPKILDDLSPAGCAKKALDAGYSSPWAPVLYVADGDCRNWDTSWGEWGKTRVSIHMPRWASRLTLEVVSVRVERLHDITEEDARAEGAEVVNGHPVLGALIGAGPSHREGFAQLWRDINGAESWDSNPWVWRVEFRKVGGR